MGWTECCYCSQGTKLMLGWYFADGPPVVVLFHRSQRVHTGRHAGDKRCSVRLKLFISFTNLGTIYVW